MSIAPRRLPVLACITAALAVTSAFSPAHSAPEASIPGSGADLAARAKSLRPSVSVNLTMQQLTPNRVYQRSSKTGGAAGKGVGTIAVPISLTSAAALVECRLRDATASGNPVLRGWTVAAVNVPASATSVPCSDVPADQKQYLVDLRGNADDSEVVLGTSPVMMGRVIVHWGQSQANQFITAAGTPPVLAPASSAYLRHGKWAPIPANALGMNPFLYMEGRANGVAVGLVAHAVDNSVIASWLPATGTSYPGLIAQVDMAGGFEAMDEHIGGSDLGVSTSTKAFVDAKRAVIRDLQDKHNPIWGRDTELVLTATTVRRANDKNGASTVEAQQAAERDLAVELGGAYYEGWDMAMMANDSVHFDAKGNPAYAYGLSRAFTALRTRGSLAAGPTITSATMAGPAITLAVALPPGGGALSVTGNPVARFTAFPAGNTTSPLKIASVSADKGRIVLQLATPPKGDVDIWLHRYPDPDPALGAAVIRDGYTADGAPYGRLVEPTVGAPVTADNPVPAVIAAMKGSSTADVVAQP
jgi:hypothetical protein